MLSADFSPAAQGGDQQQAAWFGKSGRPRATIHALLSLTSGDATAWLSARDDGLWRTLAGTDVWERIIGADDHPVAVTCLAAAPDDPATVYAGSAGALFRSGDGGRTWRDVPLPAPAPVITAIALSPAFADDGTLWLATLDDGVLRSDDRGDHWRRWNFGLLDLTVYALACSPGFADDETLYAGTETALARSENGGRAWRETTFPEAAGPVLSLATDANGAVWAGTEAAGLWFSTDAGQTWRQVPLLAPATPVPPDVPAGLAGPVNHLLWVGDALVIGQSHAVHAYDPATDSLRPLPLPEAVVVAALAADRAIPGSLLMQFQDGRVQRTRLARHATGGNAFP